MSNYRAKPRDEMGSRVGTTASAVNGAVTRQWQTLEEIARKSGKPLKAVRRRLYHGVETGVYLREKTVRFKFNRVRKK